MTATTERNDGISDIDLKGLRADADCGLTATLRPDVLRGLLKRMDDAEKLNQQRAQELNAAAGVIVRHIRSAGNWRDIARDLAELAGMWKEEARQFKSKFLHEVGEWTRTRKALEEAKAWAAAWRRSAWSNRKDRIAERRMRRDDHDRAATALHIEQEQVEHLQHKLAILEADSGLMFVALLKYGRHLNFCPHSEHGQPETPCTCGLAEAVESGSKAGEQ